MLSCAKPKVLAYLSQAAKQDRLAITEDLALVKSRDLAEDNSEDYYPAQYESVDPARKELLRSLMLEKLDAYLSSHQLEAKLPEAVVGSNIVPRYLVDSMPRSLTVPLSDSSDNGQGEQRFQLSQLDFNPIMYKIVKQFFLHDFILYRNDRSWLREEGDDTVPVGSEVQGHRFGPPSPRPDRPENVESPHLGPPLVGAQRCNDDLQADEAQGRLRGRALRTPARRASASLGDLGPRTLQGVQEID